MNCFRQLGEVHGRSKDSATAASVVVSAFPGALRVSHIPFESGPLCTLSASLLQLLLSLLSSMLLLLLLGGTLLGCDPGSLQHFGRSRWSHSANLGSFGSGCACGFSLPSRVCCLSINADPSTMNAQCAFLDLQAIVERRPRDDLPTVSSPFSWFPSKP